MGALTGSGVSSAVGTGVGSAVGSTVGSIVGACIGFDNIPAHWYNKFNDSIVTYIVGYENFSIEDAVKRFIALNN